MTHRLDALDLAMLGAGFHRSTILGLLDALLGPCPCSLCMM
jgi:hypothetical protein